MSKQTAVEWLISQLNKDGFAQVVTKEEIAQAKKMEEEQIIDAVSQGWDNHEEGKVRWLGEQYYNKTYKGGKQ